MEKRLIEREIILGQAAVLKTLPILQVLKRTKKFLCFQHKSLSKSLFKFKKLLSLVLILWVEIASKKPSKLIRNLRPINKS